jgi:hypothetical protein
MPNPPKPLVPNITTGAQTGRLSTDRYDFEAHIEGTNFRHQANQIDLFPTLVIGGNTKYNVQDALAALAAAVLPPVINDATTTVKGILRLAGDLGGNASLVTVTGIQGKPISNLAPTTNDVLTWNGVTWIPAAATNAFSAAGDLGGNNVLQQVIGLTGVTVPFVGNVVNSAANRITFNSNVSQPIINQAPATIGAGTIMTIQAQGTSAFGFNGGDVFVTGGVARPGFGSRGGVQLGVGSGSVFQTTEQVIGQRVVALSDGGISNVEMPFGTGDMVMYIQNTATPPTSANPSNGAILYAEGGQLRVRQQDGNDFFIGSIPNPSVWGSSGQQTYTNRSYTTTSGNTPVLAFNFTLPDLTSTRADVIIIGKQLSSTDSAQFNLSIGYSRDGGGSPVALGTLTNADPRYSGAATGWTAPNITTSGNNIQVYTGAATGATINWLTIVQLTMCS